MSKKEKLTDEEKKRRRKIANFARRMEISKEEAEKHLDEFSGLLNEFNNKIGGKLKIIGIKEFKGREKSEN